MGYLDKFRFCPVCGSQNFNDHDFKSVFDRADQAMYANKKELKEHYH